MGKKFLLLTASVGSGHEKAAGAIAEGIKKSFPQAQLDIVDFMSWHTSAVNAFMKGCYLKMLSLVPNLYEFMYQFTAGKRKGGCIQLLMAYAMSISIKNLIRTHEPDVIICTHPFPAEAVSHLGEKWRKKFLSAAVITDYSVHQMWICPHMNLYFVGCDFMQKQLIADGIAQNTIYVTGIPVAENFQKEKDKLLCRQKLGLAKNKPVILLMGGGLGLGRIGMALEQLEAIDDSLQLLVVAGRNRELLHKAEAVSRQSHHKILVYGYTDKVHELMGAADILLTKPGALTLTEALSLGLPMLLHEPIPGPETDNARYMSGCGSAIWLHAGDNLAYILKHLLADKYKLTAMGEAARKNRKPEAVHEILRVIKESMDISN